MNDMKRFLRHLFTTTAHGRRAFPADVLRDIQAEIARGERLHRAEVRLVIEASLDLIDLLARQSSRQRARELFSTCRVWDTEENTGILLYVNLADHKVEIIADRGVARLIEATQWQHICQLMTRGFAAGRYREAAIQAIATLNTLLAAHLPADDGSNPDELSNRPLIL